MSTRQDELTALLGAVADTPEDDTPRLILADWLEEHGEGARAEFIRVQCELARLPEYDPRRAELKQREEALLQAHEDTWRKGEPPIWKVSFERGLLTAEVPEGDVATVASHERWWETQQGWLTRLQFNFCGEADVQNALRSKPLERVPELVLTWGVTDSSLIGLPRLGGLRTLHLEGQRLTDVALRQVAGRTQLRSLSLLVPDAVTDAGIQALANLGGLRRLELTGQSGMRSLDGPGGSRVTEAGMWFLTNLGQLEVVGLPFGEQMANWTLPYLAQLPHLRKLDFTWCFSLTDAACKPLASLGGLEELKFAGCRQLTDATLAHLAGLTELRRLELNGMRQVTRAGLKYLAGLERLEHLDLSSTGVDLAGVKSLARFTTLRFLDLHNLAVTDAALAALVRLQRLQGLSFDLYQVTAKGLRSVAALPDLRLLNLCGYRGLLTKAALDTLSQMQQLRILNLQQCDDVPEGAGKRLREALPQCTVYT
jgi:uncharacterized protein (TIGR02996 family)